MVGVAQLAEHRVVAPAVEGSNPFTHPTFQWGMRNADFGLRNEELEEIRNQHRTHPKASVLYNIDLARPLENIQFGSDSRKARILTGGVHGSTSRIEIRA